ncbi:MAG: hypothetical protein ACODAU_01485 [Myxococcota bacterium]
MRARNWMILSLAGLVGLGCSAIVDGELSDKPFESEQDGGTDLCGTEFCPPGAEDGTSCSTSSMPDHICVDGCCTERRCGDGYVDTDAGEECDDGNDVNGDGCEDDCTITCTMDADCDDGEGCDGEERCVDNVCEEGDLLPNGTPCQLGTADGGIISASCQDGVCTP